MHIFISAGEASGDLHGSHLVAAIRSLDPSIRLSCLGGPLLRSSGAPVVVDHREISVVGASEVLSHARAIFGAWRKIQSHLLASRPEVVVLIDFPDFNFFLGKFAKKIGARIFYYISPQVWAWREYRVHTIKRLVDRMAVILPFEKEFYGARGMDVEYVGHPLVDILGSVPGLERSAQVYGSDSGGPLIGILPGSRGSEIKLLFALLMDSAAIVARKLPEAKFLLPVAPSLNPERIKAYAANWDLPVRIVSGDTYRVIRACDLILTASGTVTLESAILGTPMVITNRVSRLSGEIAKRLIRVKWVGLPNLIAGRQVVPEFVQDNARPELIAAEATSLLRQRDRLEEQRVEFAKMRESLGQPGISERVAKLILETAGVS